MSKSVEEQLKGTTPKIDVPFINATFKGTYFKAGGIGMQTAPYEKHVKIPLSFLEQNSLTPIGIFKAKLAPRVMTDVEGYSGIRTCRLIKCDEIPKHLPLNQQLNWTADFSALSEIARIWTPMLKPSLWPDSAELREAIRRCKAEPDVYLEEQVKRETGDYAAQRTMDDELAALGYN